MIPAGFLLAGSFFFWPFLTSFLSHFAVAIPAVGVALLLFVLVDRLVRFRKTGYEVGPQRIVVETGSIFRSRSVELDLRNVTLVEWNSPWLLRTFYDVGHITAQEAGSASQPAKMAYIEDPGELYERIGEHMRNRGFSMERSRRIRQEEPGHLGAVVDLTASLLAMFWAVILVGSQVAIEALPLIIGEGPSLLQLVMGNYEVFAESTAVSTLVRARIGALLLGGLTVSLTAVGVGIAYLDLLHRTYTLYDDVIDYVDGFLNETRKFIPLENLADTQVKRPFYKRLLGLSDVRISSQGAENSIAFASTPNGPEFAEAIEGLVRASKRPEDEAAPGTTVPAESTRQTDERESAPGDNQANEVLELQPEPVRAALRGLGLSTLVISGILGFGADFLGESWDLNLMTALGLWGAVVTAIVALLAAASLGGIWWIVRARRTHFVVDARGVRQSFSLFSSNDVRFALERITSISILRNPVDRLLGTMTVRFRSIGSEEDLDFWGVADDTRLLELLRERFGMEVGRRPTHSRHDAPDGRLTPDFRVVDAILARAPIYAVVVIPLLIGALSTVAYSPLGALPVFGVFVGLIVVGVAGHLALRWLVHSRIHGDVFDAHVEVSGGVFRHWRHFAPLEHVKACESLRYPSSRCGRLSFRTAGFPIQTEHVHDVGTLHESVDVALSSTTAGTETAERLAHFQPQLFTEMVRHAWLLLTVIGSLALPVIYVYFRRVRYHVESGRVIAQAGLYFERRVTVLFERIDHIESRRGPAHSLSGTHDIEIYTVGSPQTDLVLRALHLDDGALETVRRHLE